MKMIKTDKLVFEYAKRDEEGNIIGKSRAIDEVSLDIEPGQFIAILGHNGSGKSTLAKHMNALLVPSDGTMWVDGMDTKEDEHLWDVRQSAGMVFQNPDNQIMAPPQPSRRQARQTLEPLRRQGASNFGPEGAVKPEKRAAWRPSFHICSTSLNALI